MNHATFQERLLDYIDGRLPEKTALEMKTYIETHSAAQQEVAEIKEADDLLHRLPKPSPAPAVRAQFYQMLEREKRLSGTCRASNLKRPWSAPLFGWLLPSRPALQAVFILTVLAGGVFLGSHFSPGHDSTAKEIAALRSQIDAMGKLVTYSLLQKQPTGERLKGVLATLEVSSPDDRTLTDLIATLALDSNVNVRLAALDALAPHSAKPLVLAGIRAALSRESSPVAQVAMIDVLTGANDSEALPLFDKLASDESAPAGVQEAARRGLGRVHRGSSPS